MARHWNERKERFGDAGGRGMIFPIIHICVKEMWPRLQQFRAIVHPLPDIVEKLSSLAPGHPLNGQREMVCVRLIYVFHCETLGTI